MDDESTLKRKAESKDEATRKKKKKKWPCQWAGCPRWAQSNRNKMCKNHNNETILCQSIGNNLNQSNTDAQQGAIVLAGFCEHINNTEIDGNISTEEGTRNDAPTVSYHNNSTIDCVTANNTTVSNVELQTAAENVETQTDGEVNGRSASHSLSINASENNTAEIQDVNDESVGEHRNVDSTIGEVNCQPQNFSSSQSSNMALVESRINVLKTQNHYLQQRLEKCETENHDLKLRITELEEKMKKSFSIPSFSLSDNNELDPIIGLTAYPFRRQKKRTAKSHDSVVARLVSPNTGLRNTGVICYSNAIFQALASCYRKTTLFNHSLHAPNQDPDRFRLCFAFAEVLHSLVNRPSSEPFVFNPRRFIDVFQQTHSNFIDEESEYCLHRGRPR
jgi:hypothetical protein